MGAAPWPGRRLRRAVPPSFTCPCCGAVSFHPADLAQGYCGRCHWHTGDPLLGAPHRDSPCPHRDENAPRSPERTA